MPSEILKSGDTADIQCAELAVQYETYLHKEAENNKDGKTSTHHSQEELLNMLQRVKNKNETNAEDK